MLDQASALAERVVVALLAVLLDPVLPDLGTTAEDEDRAFVLDRDVGGGDEPLVLKASSMAGPSLRLRAASRFVTAATFSGSPRRGWRPGHGGPDARDAKRALLYHSAAPTA